MNWDCASGMEGTLDRRRNYSLTSSNPQQLIHYPVRSCHPSSPAAGLHPPPTPGGTPFQSANYHPPAYTNSESISAISTNISCCPERILCIPFGQPFATDLTWQSDKTLNFSPTEMKSPNYGCSWFELTFSGITVDLRGWNHPRKTTWDLRPLFAITGRLNSTIWLYLVVTHFQP